MLWGSSFHSRKPPPHLPTSPAEPLALRCIHPGSLSRSLFRVCCRWGFGGPGSPCAELTNPAFQGLPSQAGTEKGPTDGNALCRFTHTPCTGHTDFGVRTGSMTCPLPACRRRRWAGRGQSSRGARGQLRPEPHGTFLCGDSLGQSLPAGSRGLLKAQRSHTSSFKIILFIHLFWLCRALTTVGAFPQRWGMGFSSRRLLLLQRQAPGGRQAGVAAPLCRRDSRGT